MRKVLAVGATLLGLVGLSVVLARPSPQASPVAQASPGGREAARPLTPEALSVRILMGLGDESPQPWNGKASVDPGEVLGVEGYRLRDGSVTGPAAWTARSLPARKAFVAKKKLVASKKAAPPGPAVVPTGVVVRMKAPADAILTLTTEQGEVLIGLADLASGAPKRFLDGRIEARLVPTHAPLADSTAQEDYAASAPDGKAAAWVAYVEHQSRGPEASAALKAAPKEFKDFVPTGGGDQIKLLHFDGSQADLHLVVTPAGLDVWRPAVAVGGGGKVVVVWSQLVDANWDLYARTYDPSARSWGETKRLTTDPGTDTDPALVSTGEQGDVWVAWQAWRGGQADILLAPIAAKDPAEVINVSNHPANDWSPSLASSGAALFVAYDTYRSGNYDVLLSSVSLTEGQRRKATVPVADGPRFEVRPSLAVDSKGRAWVAYEERSEHWGKDFGVHDRAGTPIYQTSAVRVRCVDVDRVLDAGDPLAAGAPGERPMNSFPRLTLDRSGRPWLLFRHRQENNPFTSPVPVVGAVWYEYATALSGKEWTPPQPLPRSDNLLDNRPALSATKAGPVLAFYSGDGRLHRERAAGQGPAPFAGAMSQVNNDLFVAALNTPRGSADPVPGAPVAKEEPRPLLHPTEAEDLARIRAYRLTAGGKTYRLLRGEFHRHTEISPDGGGDGSLEDMWRYGLDAGALDWIGCGDHDNGNGREYTWWMTQKTTELYHIAPAFVPMFTYERSVNYPAGHRNVMFPDRGVRTLPRLVGDAGPRIDVNGRDEDAQMLYRYLTELNGICAAHTSATDMGTDWRANDPKVEPFVEIYQGDRDSYEHLGAPRAAHGPGDAVGGWRPLGMVWNALAMQYRLGFQSSSDHISTHISFAVAIAEAPTRAAIFDAFRKRHCYAATDNIVLDVRCGNHLMGDEFAQDGPVTLKVMALGTAPVKRVDIIKDFHYVYSAEPKAPRVEFTWTDEDGTNREPSWYYVRVVQDNDEVAWGSPMWVHRTTPVR
jgi:hypothetical protein